MKTSIIKLAAAYLILFLSIPVQPQSGGAFEITQSVIAGGGGQNATGGTFSLDGTIGQSIAGGALNGSPFAVTSGFWNFSPTTPVVQGFEGDVASRPNGDGSILSNDVVQVRRFLNGTHTIDPSVNEFQRADSFPFATKGDGAINSADVVQTRRYQNGTSPQQTAGGPLQAGGAKQSLTDEVEKPEAESKAPEGNPREVRVENATGSAGQTVTVNIRVNAVGNEAEYGFILSYDQTKLSNPVIGAGTAGASVRSCNIATAGTINCSVGGFPNNNPTSSDAGIGETGAGTNQLLITITFTVAANAPVATTAPALSNVNASSDAPQLFTPTATNKTVTILAPTAAPVSISGRIHSGKDNGIIRRVRVHLIDATTGIERVAQTSFDGAYRFGELEVRHFYIIKAESKNFLFSPDSHAFELLGETTDVDFTGERIQPSQ